MPSVASISSGRRPQNVHSGEYLLLALALPGEPERKIGVLLRDSETGQLYPRIRDNWEEIRDPEEAEWLEALGDDFEGKIREMGSDEFLRSLEDSLSNALRLSQRFAVSVDDFPRTLARLYAEHVEAADVAPEDVQPFITHLPLYSLQAAATRFGEDREVEAQGWVKAPAKLLLTPDMFVGRVVGRSMEPRIPDGSLCVFRKVAVGSRQGKLVLVERMGATDTSTRYTIKKYTSQKRRTGDDAWEHAGIRLEPLNKEFEGFDLKEGEARVIAEFIQVLE
ncbi:MAG TPA: S24 family peptidase [Bryobacteraceae bacterium]|nr:S24 family peptidase [Bryobacteraceae bacterium]